MCVLLALDGCDQSAGDPYAQCSDLVDLDVNDAAQAAVAAKSRGDIRLLMIGGVVVSSLVRTVDLGPSE
jgi:hypothetical protein